MDENRINDLNMFDEVEERLYRLYPETESLPHKMAREKKEQEEMVKRLKEEYTQHYKGVREFVDSFDSCSVSVEILGEWNVIREEINNYLLHHNSNSDVGFYGDCPYMNVFLNQEKEHLKSIKSKVGANSIELQMICSLVAEAVILEIEKCLIGVKEKQRTYRSGYVEQMIDKQYLQNFFQDCLDVMANASSLNMEYQYKYERFTPFYKSLIEQGKRAGLAIEEPSKTKSGCLSVIIIAIVSTLLCSFILI